jgi:hypothetical protein
MLFTKVARMAKDVLNMRSFIVVFRNVFYGVCCLSCKNDKIRHYYFLAGLANLAVLSMENIDNLNLVCKIY